MIDGFIKLGCFLVFILSVNYTYSQSKLSNPSFEDEKADATMPSGWWSCQKGTTPDILPDSWGVYNLPKDGQTYVGIITREDGSYEAIGQRLDAALKKGQCYEMTLYIAHSGVYAGYDTPIRLSIYLGQKKCERDQLVFRTERIKKEPWQLQEISFTPDKDMYYITLMADDDGKNINGNILIDNISEIVKCKRANITDHSSSSSKL